MTDPMTAKLSTEEAEAMIAALIAIGANAECDCGNPASCVGAYEGQDVSVCCDVCCGHGNEDGSCKSLIETLDPIYTQLRQAVTATAQVREAEALIANLQAHAKEAGWQDVDEPIAALLAYPLTPPPARPTHLDPDEGDRTCSCGASRAATCVCPTAQREESE